jgi:hypothetical protein
MVIGFVIYSAAMNCESAPRPSTNVLWSESENRDIASVRNQADHLLRDKLSSCVPSSADATQDVGGGMAGHTSVGRRIDKLFNLDQNARLMYQMAGYHQDSLARVIARNMDEMNLPMIRDIFSEFGLLTPSKAGKDVSEKFMTLVIHADGDREFQLKVVSAAEHETDSELDKETLAPAIRIIKGRGGYHRESPLSVPYPVPSINNISGSQLCMSRILSEWFPGMFRST